MCNEARSRPARSRDHAGDPVDPVGEWRLVTEIGAPAVADVQRALPSWSFGLANAGPLTSHVLAARADPDGIHGSIESANFRRIHASISRSSY